MNDDNITIGQLRFGPMIDPQPRIDLQLPPSREFADAQARIADLEAQLATAYADGYAAGVRDAAAIVEADIKPICAFTFSENARHFIRRILSLLPPDSKKGGA